jgi:hypothetical protein
VTGCFCPGREGLSGTGLAVVLGALNSLRLVFMTIQDGIGIEVTLLHHLPPAAAEEEALPVLLALAISARRRWVCSAGSAALPSSASLLIVELERVSGGVVAETLPRRIYDRNTSAKA